MTSYLSIEQLIADRQADLARSWPRRAKATRWGRSFKLRRDVGTARRRARVAPRSQSAVPLDDVGLRGADAAGTSAASIADLVAEHGLSENEPAIAHVLRRARRHGPLPIHAEILADRSLPDVVRERALGRLLMWLATPADAPQRAFDDAA